MKYLEFTFTTTPASDVAEDILSDLLAGIGFDSFVRPDDLEWEKCEGSENPESPEFQVLSGEDLFKAYIQTDAFDKAALDEVIAAFPLPDVEVSYTMCEAEDKDMKNNQTFSQWCKTFTHYGIGGLLDENQMPMEEYIPALRSLYLGLDRFIQAQDKYIFINRL